MVNPNILAILFSISMNGELTYTKDAKPIFKKHCASCHSSSWPDKNWMDYDTAFKNKDKIKLRVENKTMPPGNITDMTESERNTIIEWVNQGAKK
jgi:uncharacterized membrane protein